MSRLSQKHGKSWAASVSYSGLWSGCLSPTTVQSAHKGKHCVSIYLLCRLIIYGRISDGDQCSGQSPISICFLRQLFFLRITEFWSGTFVQSKQFWSEWEQHNLFMVKTLFIHSCINMMKLINIVIKIHKGTVYQKLNFILSENVNSLPKYRCVWFFMGTNWDKFSITLLVIRTADKTLDKKRSQ